MSQIKSIAGTFVIHAEASFLNGAGLGDGEDRNVTIPKTLQDGRRRVPYVSAQAWKRWLRDTFIAETGWPASVLKAIGKSDKDTSNKISGELDPIGFPEDDIFGYMRAQKGQGKKSEDEESSESDDEEESVESASEKKGKKGVKTKAVMRSSPFSASILVSLRKDGWRGRDEGFVHLKEGTPLPYTTEFYTTNLHGIFCLAYDRLGVFSNQGDRIELDPEIAAKYSDNQLIKTPTGYELTNSAQMRKDRATALLKSLVVLRGGAKQAAFGTDVAPKCVIMAGMSCGNPIFNHLFEDDPEKGVSLKIEPLRQVLSDYADRIVTPVVIGYRAGYLTNGEQVDALAGDHEFVRGKVQIVIASPVDAAAKMASYL